MKTYTLTLNDGTSLDMTEDQVNRLSPEDEASVTKMVEKVPQSTGYSYPDPNEYQDLLANTRDVGYSGLDADQKKLYDSQFPSSQAALGGMTLEQAHQRTDQLANTPSLEQPSLRQQIGEAIRMPLAPVAGSLGAIAAGASGLWDAPWGYKLYYANKQAGLQYPVSMDKAIRGEGLEGIVADPTNLLALAPTALGEKAVLYAIPKAAPWLAKTLGGALEGGALTAASQTLNPSTQPTLKSVGIGAGLGGGMSLVGQGLKAGGLDMFPNRDAYQEYLGNQLHNQVNASAVADKNIGDLYNSTSFPIRQNKLIAVNEANREAAGEGMQDAIETTMGSTPIPQTSAADKLLNQPLPTDQISGLTSGLAPVFRNFGNRHIPLRQGAGSTDQINGLTSDLVQNAGDRYNELGQQALQQWPAVSPVRGTSETSPGFLNLNGGLEDLRNEAHTVYDNRTAANPTASDYNQVHRAIDRRVNDIKNKMAVRPAVYPKGSLSVGQYNPVTGQIEAVPMPAIYSATDLSAQKHVVSSQFHPTNNPERVGIEADEAVHDAINNTLNKIPNYAAAAAPYSKQYAAAKGLGNYVKREPSNPRRVPRALPWLFNNYAGPGNLYKLGQFIGGNIGPRIIAPGLSGYLVPETQLRQSN